MTTLSNTQIQQLWIQNGGNPQAAPIAAAIAQAESGGNSLALNNNPSTGDYSVGLWQTNYYGSLLASRTKDYGSPAALQADPNLQAQSAVGISGNGSSWTPWSTYNSGAYLQYLNGATTTSSTASGGTVGSSQPIATIGNLSQLGTNPAAGFNPNLQTPDFIVNGGAITADVQASIKDAIVNRTISTASTVTLQIADPTRKLLRSGIFKVGYLLEIDDLVFSLVQTTKASDTIQVVFESAGIAALRQQTGVQATTTSNNITSFIQSLVQAVDGLGFVGFGGLAYADAQNTTAVSIGRGTTADPFEDSWTCIQRVATSAGWRCFEVNNTVYLGPDSFFLSQAQAATFTEFTGAIQNMDFDYDVGKPFGTVTVTGMLGLWAYNPGQVIGTYGMGPLDGQPWLIQSMQRDLFNPEMTSVLYAPQTPQYAIAAPTYAPF